MVASYIICFVCGFLLDKLRLFPLLLGMVLGLMIKSLLDDTMLSHMRDQLYTAAGRVFPTPSFHHELGDHIFIIPE